MNKEQVISLVRHILSALGGLVIAKGLGSEALITSIVGAIISVGTVVWSVIDKTASKDMLYGALRQIFTILGGFVSFFSTEHAEALLGAIAAILASIMGIKDKVEPAKE